jgi:hypothetical protein
MDCRPSPIMPCMQCMQCKEVFGRRLLFAPSATTCSFHALLDLLALGEILAKPHRGSLTGSSRFDAWAPAATPIDARVPELARNATLCRSHLACKETRLAAQYACFSWVHQPTLASLVRASLPRACAVGSMRKAQGLSPLAVVGAVRWKTGAEDSHPRVCGPGFALHMPLRWPPRQSDGARRRGLTSLQRCRWRRIQIRAAASYYNASPKNMRRGVRREHQTWRFVRPLFIQLVCPFCHRRCARVDGADPMNCASITRGAPGTNSPNSAWLSASTPASHQAERNAMPPCC